MAKPMFPFDGSSLTDGQIGKYQEMLGGALRQRRRWLPKDASQEVLTKQGACLQAAASDLFQRLVEGLTKVQVRHIHVNPTRHPRELLNETRRKQHVNDAVLKSMPRGERRELEILFFRADRWLTEDHASGEELYGAYEQLGIEPDPYALTQLAARGGIYDQRVVTFWRNEHGKLCFICFRPSVYEGPFRVIVDEDQTDEDGFWYSRTYLAGVRTAP